VRTEEQGAGLDPIRVIETQFVCAYPTIAVDYTFGQQGGPHHLRMLERPRCAFSIHEYPARRARAPGPGFEQSISKMFLYALDVTTDCRLGDAEPLCSSHLAASLNDRDEGAQMIETE
jgi:hypothetical protein